MTNKELSVQIRKELKEAGIVRTDYSIRVQSAGYSTAVNIVVKNPKVRLSDVKKVAGKYEEMDRDERTGEILMGGNTFVNYEYATGIYNGVVEPFLEWATELFETPKYDGYVISENERASLSIMKEAETVKYLYERSLADTSGCCGDKIVIRSSFDLACALWRFKEAGTIFT